MVAIQKRPASEGSSLSMDATGRNTYSLTSTRRLEAMYQHP
jgi:hypothetical protein